LFPVNISIINRGKKNNIAGNIEDRYAGIRDVANQVEYEYRRRKQKKVKLFLPMLLFITNFNCLRPIIK